MFADTTPQAEPLVKPSSELALVLDLDFLPERYRRRRLTVSALRPALFALGFALLLIPLGRYAQAASRQLAAVEASLAQVQGELQGYQPLAEERAGLEARVASARSAAAEIQIAYDAVDIQDITWNHLLKRVLAVRPAGVGMTRIAQDGSEVFLEGLAVSHDLPANYADALARLSNFSGVVLQSVTRVELAPDPEAANPEVSDPAPEALPEIAYFFEISAFLPAPEPPAPAPEQESP